MVFAIPEESLKAAIFTGGQRIDCTWRLENSHLVLVLDNGTILKVFTATGPNTFKDQDGVVFEKKD